jgi:hypothetical protein
MSWQNRCLWHHLQAAARGLNCATLILSEVSAPIQHSVLSLETSSEDAIPLEDSSIAPPVYNVTAKNHSILSGGSQAMENRQPS